MAKGKSKSTIAPNVKAAVCTAALLASGASAKGLRQSRASDKEVVVASFHLSSKQDLNDDPPPNPNLTVTEKVIAETAPFQMIRQKRSMEMEEQDAPGPEERKMKTKKAKEAKKKKKAESSDSSSSSSDSEEEKPKKRKAK